MDGQDTQTFKRLVIAAYRVPYKLVKRRQKTDWVQNSGGLVSAMLTLSQKMDVHFSADFAKTIIWIGHSEHSREEFAAHGAGSENVDIFPVSIDPKVHRNYYNGFCNGTLWPLFHYFPSLTVFDDASFGDYLEANRRFFEVIEKIIQPGDLIWVHDYQLFLLPAMIRDRFPEASIGFFQHIPFPSYEIFRMLKPERREQILKGMLGADLIGFHTNDYTQHFLHNVRRVLGYQTTLGKISTDRGIVKADAFPIGIDYDKFSQAAKSPSVRKEIAALKSEIGDKKFIFSVDRLDYTKGILHRLLGFEYFLEKYPEWKNRTIFNMVVVPSRDEISQYRAMKKEIEATVGRINGKFGSINWEPIIYQYKSLSFNQLIALYNFSDAGLITPLRDGMNLVAKEYVAGKSDTPGVLILSEMAGAVAELGEAIIINPTDRNGVADAIFKALEMNEKESLVRLRKMQTRLKTYNVFSWTSDFIEQLELIKAEQKMMEVRIINSEILRGILHNFMISPQRAVFLDYDGTLSPISKSPEQAKPSSRLIDQLERLSVNPRNMVAIMSGRQKEFLEAWFGRLNLFLVAEHGAFLKIPEQEWASQIDLNQEWQQVVHRLMQRYVKRCYGSFIEEKTASLAWHYRNSDADFAFVRLQELKEELQEMLVNSALLLQIVEGHKVLEVKLKGYDKGSAALHIFHRAPAPDFILAIGDDTTDEDLFKALPATAVTIRVGAVSSNARYNLRNQSDVISLLDKLTEMDANE